MEKEARFIYDPIHGHIQLDSEFWPVIDNPVFQRLRNLKQLGTTCYVFPSATHTRFEHSIGVAYLSNKYIKMLKKKQPELEITSRDISNVSLAGLLHDLGHGPFSHIFDADVLPALDIKGWAHEEASVNLFKYMIDEYNLDIEESDRKEISDMILGNGHGFKHQIVNNKLNSIDVDKMDYIDRDCYSLGFRAIPYDTMRVLKCSRVIDDVICYNDKVVHSVYSLFQNRFSLFQQCYSHKVGQSIALMIRDALVLAEPHLNLKERIQDPQEYYRLDDNVLNEILYTESPELQPAKKIINDISFRNLYRYAGEIILPQTSPYEHITSEKIAGYAPNLQPDNLIVKDFKLTYGNPADQVWYYSQKDQRHKIPKERISNLLPYYDSDRYVRVFVKDPQKLQTAKSALEAFKKAETH